MPDNKDDRVKSCTMQLFTEKYLGKTVVATLQPAEEQPWEPYKKSNMWKEVLKQDERYSKAVLCLKNGARRFPPHL